MARMAPSRIALFCWLTSPAGWGAEAVPQPDVQVGPCVLAVGAPRVLNRTPEEAVVALEATVLLMMSVFNASSSEIPAPSQPATLLTMTLFCRVTWYHCDGVFGKAITSEPLTCSRAIPPPPPLSAALPCSRLALIIRPGPAPSLSPGMQSTSVTEPHSDCVAEGASGAVPMTMSPPPLVAIVGLVL